MYHKYVTWFHLLLSQFGNHLFFSIFTFFKKLMFQRVVVLLEFLIQYALIKLHPGVNLRYNLLDTNAYFNSFLKGFNSSSTFSCSIPKRKTGIFSRTPDLLQSTFLFFNILYPKPYFAFS